MALHFLPLLRLPTGLQLIRWTFENLAGRIKPMLTDLTGTVQRAGDVIIWDSPKGRQVLAICHGASFNSHGSWRKQKSLLAIFGWEKCPIPRRVHDRQGNR
jgi:hypothetical protein